LKHGKAEKRRVLRQRREGEEKKERKGDRHRRFCEQKMTQSGILQEARREIFLMILLCVVTLLA